MTITIVLPFINLTGGIRVMLDYANHLHDAGHQVTVVYPHWPYQFQYTRRQQWGEFLKHGRHDGRVPWFDLRCRLLRVPLVRAMFMPKADLVVAAGWPTAHDVSPLPPSCGRKVLIVFHHESGTGPETKVEAIYGLPFYRIAFSEFVRTTITARFRCVIHDVVPNGVDTGVFYPEGEPDRRSVLFLYHPDPRKGAADGIEALRRLPADVEVRVIGPVRPPAPLPWPEFEFHPDDRSLRRRYSRATVLLYPSRDEGFGLPPLEAMACGCPPVTTSVGAVPEFAHEGNAVVVAPGDVGAMTAGLRRLLTDPVDRNRLSRQGLATAQAYALARVAPLFEQALTRALTHRDQ